MQMPQAFQPAEQATDLLDHLDAKIFISPLSPAAASFDYYSDLFLGLTPQALRCRLLRRLAPGRNRSIALDFSDCRSSSARSIKIYGVEI
jgi:hypothetical protein